MANDGWMEYNGREIINVARTARLARALRVGAIRIPGRASARIEDALATGGQGAPVDYEDPAETPWYDPDYTASTDFIGAIPLAVQGLDDSTLESTPIEYITDGGHPGHPRSSTLPVVFNLALVGRSEAGVEYGRRWLARTLRDSGARAFCAGSDLTYFRWAGTDAPKVHRRDVRLTRGISVTAKHQGACTYVWLVTFTMTAGDPYEYGEEVPQVSDLGGTTTGPAVAASGALDLTYQGCPVYDYSPVYDPLHPALVAAPSAPDVPPDGWSLTDGMTFRRHWARLEPFEPSDMLAVPVFTLTSPTEARLVRLSVYDFDATTSTQCSPLYSVIVTYVPPAIELTIDGEQRAAYVWDGASPLVRRADTLLYGPEAKPVEWSAFPTHAGVLVTMDVFNGATGVRGSLSLVSKSD